MQSVVASTNSINVTLAVLHLWCGAELPLYANKQGPAHDNVRCQCKQRQAVSSSVQLLLPPGAQVVQAGHCVSESRVESRIQTHRAERCVTDTCDASAAVDVSLPTHCTA